MKKNLALDEAIEKVLVEMREHDPETQEYQVNLKNLERLSALKKSDKRPVSWDTIALGGFGLLQFMGLVIHDNRHILKQNVLGFMFKPKATK